MQRNHEHLNLSTTNQASNLGLATLDDHRTLADAESWMQ
jgi:hypothetical protein